MFLDTVSEHQFNILRCKGAQAQTQKRYCRVLLIAEFAANKTPLHTQFTRSGVKPEHYNVVNVEQKRNNVFNMS